MYQRPNIKMYQLTDYQYLYRCNNKIKLVANAKYCVASLSKPCAA